MAELRFTRGPFDVGDLHGQEVAWVTDGHPNQAAQDQILALVRSIVPSTEWLEGPVVRETGCLDFRDHSGCQWAVWGVARSEGMSDA